MVCEDLPGIIREFLVISFVRHQYYEISCTHIVIGMIISRDTELRVLFPDVSGGYPA